MTYPAVIFWLVILWSATARPAVVFVLLMASMPFASLALIPPDAIGGLSILPQSILALLFIIKVLLRNAHSGFDKVVVALQLRNGGFLLLFFLVGMTVTLVMPRLFQGEVVVVPMRDNWKLELLGPIQANFTQAGYLGLSVATALTTAVMADEPSFIEIFLKGALVGGVVCIATGLIDFALGYVGLESLLDPFRNAAYAFLTNAEILTGVRRVVGFAPEASTYGGLCVQFGTLLALSRNLYREGRERLIATLASFGLVGMALLSTSSAAYIGLAVLGLAYGANWFRRAIYAPPLGKSGLAGEVIFASALGIVLLLILLVRADLFDPLINLIGEIIFNKPLTSSFYERSHWNAVAWGTVSGTFGLGAGFGSTRTSNWFVAIVSSSGVLGALFMALFLVRVLTRRPDTPTPLSKELLPALKLSLFPVLAMEGIAAAGPDFGLWVGVLFGAISGIGAVRPERSATDLSVTGAFYRAPEIFQSGRFRRAGRGNYVPFFPRREL